MEPSQKGNRPSDDRSSKNPMNGPSLHWWSEDLSRRARVLLHAFPLLRTHRGEARQRSPELDHYDWLAIATKIVDAIVENTGLDEAVTFDSLLGILEPLLTSFDLATHQVPDAGRHHRVVEMIVGLLRNDSNRRSPFEMEYSTFSESGVPERRTLSFRFLQEEYHANGNVVLRLSTQALNLYLRALELDIESQQAAAEAIVHSQISRGKYADAARAAKNARHLSVTYRDKLLRLLRETRKNIAQVDWKNEVPHLLNDARVHLDSRLIAEMQILDGVESRLADVDNPEQLATLATVLKEIRACRERHVELHSHLIGAHDVFLTEQERQTFTSLRATSFPNLITEVLEPLLGADVSRAESALTSSAHSFFPPTAVAQFSLADLVMWQLRPRRESHRGEVEIDPIELSPMSVEGGRFPEAIVQRAEDLIAGAGSGETLSVLLRRVRDAGSSDDFAFLVALLTLQWFAPDSDSRLTFDVSRLPEQALKDPMLFGDELAIAKSGSTDG